jgi:hypothetical protein
MGIKKEGYFLPSLLNIIALAKNKTPPITLPAAM